MSKVIDKNILKENAKLKECLETAIKALYDVQTWLTCDPNIMKKLMPDFCAEQKALESANNAIEKIMDKQQPLGTLEDKNEKKLKKRKIKMPAPDYNNDLAFEPEITFHDLCA